MPGFGGNPISALIGSVPGALLRAQQVQRELEDRELERRRIQQALNIANARESRESRRFPVTLEGDRLSNEQTRLGVEDTRADLDRQSRVDELLSGVAGTTLSDDPVTNMILQAETIGGETGNVLDARNPFGVGQTPETIEQKSFLESRGRARGSFPFDMARSSARGGGGEGFDDRLGAIDRQTTAFVSTIVRSGDLGRLQRLRDDLRQKQMTVGLNTVEGEILNKIERFEMARSDFILNNAGAVPDRGAALDNANRAGLSELLGVDVGTGDGLNMTP